MAGNHNLTGPLHAPFQELPQIGSLLGITLAVQRDDLLPFPLASSKVRAIEAELDGRLCPETALITNGSVDSNHCRTLALWGAQRGVPVHLVLHGKADSPASKRALTLYHDLGAVAEVVAPGGIASALTRHVNTVRAHGHFPLVIPGGCHTPRAAIAYREAAIPVLQDWQPDIVFVASGTGAIQGGLVAAACHTSPRAQVIGVSVARDAPRGVPPVAEAADWAGAPAAEIVFDDDYRDGGYGRYGVKTRRAVDLGWSHGLPLDFTYTGKAFRALIEYSNRIVDPDTRVLFWHTGGLWNYLQQRVFG